MYQDESGMMGALISWNKVLGAPTCIIGQFNLSHLSMDACWMILFKCNDLEILCVKMLFSLETKFQMEENPPIIPENEILALNVTSNIYCDEDLTATLCSYLHLAVLNLNNCKHITLAAIEFKKLENLAFICVRNTATAPNDDCSQISLRDE